MEKNENVKFVWKYPQKSIKKSPIAVHLVETLLKKKYF